jgi:hypothetical protein
MSVETVLGACLLAASGLAGVKVRAEVAQPTDATPYIVHTQITGTRIKSLRGDSGLANPRFQIDVYADTKAQAVDLKKAIRLAVLASPELGAVLIAEASGYEADTKRYRQRQEYSFWFYD